MLILSDIRSIFLSYFEKKGHEVVSSSPLVPQNDPTLLFTNSGMVQFKSLFTGIGKCNYSRATTSQKCVRAGGKHNDLDNIGYTARHHTFFEMLGNFSFGDYFKDDAIFFAWDLVTKEFEIPKDRLLVTIYHTDDEAAEIWKKVAGFSDTQIIRIDTSDNFWTMGTTGPCGPCTEIFFDHGDQYWGGPPGSPGEDGDRFVEIWNLVFMQYERFKDGTQRELELQSIDTGMGIERVAALLQGTNDNYQTDLFRNLIEASADATSTKTDGEQAVQHRVIADHLRSISFLLADGVLPANDGRGYVLRRIMRRAMRHAHLLSPEEPIMHKLVSCLVDQMGIAYPELGQAQILIEETLKSEEARFRQTLERGLKLLEDELAELPEKVDLPGQTAFKLYDTFGFPVDLTQDVLREKNRTVDFEGFKAAMAEQRQKARAAWSGVGNQDDIKIWVEVLEANGATDFIGYDTEIAQGQILALIRDGIMVSFCEKGEIVNVVLNQTPFYAEAGGQVGDKGQILTQQAVLQVIDTQKTANVIYHTAIIKSGRVDSGDIATLEVNHLDRTGTRANHSATHLLHEALRKSLGEHVAQRGSLNSQDRLRFDFSHSQPLDEKMLCDIQVEVNAFIRQNTQVVTRIMTPEQARKLGAQAIFGEKYGDEVRVVSMGYQKGYGKGQDGNTFSIELCGGTHVKQTGEIGAFVITHETASAAGVRRIEALTGQTALDWLLEQANALSWFKNQVKAQTISDAQSKFSDFLKQLRNLQNEVVQLRREVATSVKSDNLQDNVKIINGRNLLVQILTGVLGKELPAIADQHKERIGSGIILLVSKLENKVAVAVGVTNDLTEVFSAIDLVRSVVFELDGKGGGGRSDFAQGGGSNIKKIEIAISAVEKIMEEK
ncbi:MAG: alanine--tRNA ligase [Aestuariivita sp.]|nr:alanine--tRNA ligase [Aestuariivita sp.]